MGWFKKEEKPKRVIAPQEIEEKIKDFIASKTTVIGRGEIAPDTKLFSSGLLDSLAFIEFVTYIESTFQIKLSDAMEVNVDNLDTIQQIQDALSK